MILFRNHVGAGVMGKIIKPKGRTFWIVENPRYCRFGLIEGSSDLIGWTPVRITADMVGKTVAVFTAVETKTKYKKATTEQENFIHEVNRAGGRAGVAREPHHIHDILEGKDGLKKTG